MVGRQLFRKKEYGNLCLSPGRKYSFLLLITFSRRHRCRVVARRKTIGGELASAECCCTKLKCVSKLLIIKEILVEATGVELFGVLITRKLLILGTATTAKKAPLPDPLYVYCTKMLSLWTSADSISRHSIPWIRSDGTRKNTQLPKLSIMNLLEQ